MYELFHNMQLVGLFTTEQAAQEYADQNDLGTYSIYPPGTLTNQPEFEDDLD